MKRYIPLGIALAICVATVGFVCWIKYDVSKIAHEAPRATEMSGTTRQVEYTVSTVPKEVAIPEDGILDPGKHVYHPRLPPGYRLFMDGNGKWFVKKWSTKIVQDDVGFRYASGWYQVGEKELWKSEAIKSVLDSERDKQETEVTE